ncbi:Shedu anti-phage system protein SduA domain-containing protein [Desulfitobacterium sp. PCE1]|uniref:Shedu anti-phage system protein SduA domain-containing protein n=1 Tax=Desulfitobacterium sp. PCE1 TaxID=146907 RepID=UPI00036E0FE5|nr:Shedu anti-phage system protein SduA domain-containing protein [Desulfitobacterium sp. PCE1]
MDISFVFVELQKPYGNITTKDGELGDTFRKGLKQIEDWQEWLEANYSSLYETFVKYKHPDILLDEEFHKFDRTRMHYSVVAGRRKDFTDRTYRLKRKIEEEQKILVLHYDNLLDTATNIIGKSTY